MLLSNRRIEPTLALLLILTVSLLATPARLRAADGGFEFYYQAIQEVNEEKPSEGGSWWDKAKNFGKQILNYAQMAWSQAEMRFFPGTGTKWVRSVQNPRIAYKVKRVKVTTEAELLAAMGVKSEAELTDGQRGLLAAFRAASSQAIKERQKYAYRKDAVRVLLTDTTGFDNVPTVQKDFWPMSYGSIQMSSLQYNYKGSEAHARSTFLHEYCHTLDRANPLGITWEAIRTTIKDGSPLYGKDNMHHVNEKTYPRVAYLEGWAIFNEMLESKDEADAVFRSIATIDFEKQGGYEGISATDPKVTAQDLLSVEGVVAAIMFRIAQEGKGGRQAVFEAFVGSNKALHEVKDFLREYVKRNPGETALVMRILNEQTHGKLSDAELLDLLGGTAEARAALADRGKSTMPATDEAPAAPTEDAGQSQVDPAKVTVGEGASTNPFEDR